MMFREEKKSFFGKMSQRIGDALAGKATIDDDFMDELEEILKFLFEIDNDLIEAFLELDPDRLVHIVDDPVKIVSRFLDVRPLPGKEFIPFTHRFIFFDSAHVDLSQFPHPVLHLTAFLHGHRHNELLRTEFHGLYV